MFQSGDIVEVMDYDKPTHAMAWRNSYMVEVVSQRYMAGDPWGPEFVGKAIDGRFAGHTMAIQYKHARIEREVSA